MRQEMCGYKKKGMVRRQREKIHRRDIITRKGGMERLYVGQGNN